MPVTILIPAMFATVNEFTSAGDFYLAEAGKKFGGDAGQIGGLIALLAAGLSEGLPAARQFGSDLARTGHRPSSRWCAQGVLATQLFKLAPPRYASEERRIGCLAASDPCPGRIVMNRRQFVCAAAGAAILARSPNARAATHDLVSRAGA